MPSEFNFNAQTVDIPSRGYIYNAIGRFETEFSNYINSFNDSEMAVIAIQYKEARALKKIVNKYILCLIIFCDCICCETAANAICDIGLSVLNQFKCAPHKLYPPLLPENAPQEISTFPTERRGSLKKGYVSSCEYRSPLQKYYRDVLIKDAEKTILRVVKVFCTCKISREKEKIEKTDKEEPPQILNISDMSSGSSLLSSGKQCQCWCASLCPCY